jgi:hypothetical protein
MEGTEALRTIYTGMATVNNNRTAFLTQDTVELKCKKDVGQLRLRICFEGLKFAVGGWKRGLHLHT